MFTINIAPELKDLVLGIVRAPNIRIGPPSSDLRAACEEAVRRVQVSGMGGGEPRREAVRRMLRAGGFKPSGRNKPAQEYLLRTANELSTLPEILNAVDWLNAISLESGFPISLLAASKLGSQVTIRYGRKNEKFVFNRAGQELDVEGLICICAGQGEESVPLGTPIKDSMEGKVLESDREAAFFIYAPKSHVGINELTEWCEKLAGGIAKFCEAETEVEIVCSRDSSSAEG